MFLPGVGEIRRLQQILSAESAVKRAGVAVVQLHGNLPPQQQDDVIRYLVLKLSLGVCVLRAHYMTYLGCLLTTKFTNG